MTNKESSQTFDEIGYLSRYPDVAAAVVAGNFRSGFNHFVQRGRREGRTGVFGNLLVAPTPDNQNPSPTTTTAEASDIRKVLVGKDGWLFLQNDTNHVIQQITGQFPLPAEFSSNWRELFAKRKLLLSRLKCDYVFSIAPNKECIYADKLPDGVIFSHQRPVYQVIREAESQIKVVYPYEELRERSRSVWTYPMGDTHWNIYGAFEFYKALMKVVGAPALEEERIQFVDKEFPGDLSGKLGLTTHTTSGNVKHPDYQMSFDNGLVGTGNILRYTHRNKSLPTCVIFRDSFTNVIRECLAQSFSQITFVWQPGIDFDLVETERPDFVINQQVERFLVACPSDTPARHKSIARWPSFRGLRSTLSSKG